MNRNFTDFIGSLGGLMAVLLVLFLVLHCVGCTNAKRDEPLDLSAKYTEVADRLPEFTENGWIVSRNLEDGTEHEGDSLLWTALAMAALDCERAKPYAAHLADMITRNDGALVRYEPLGEYANGREISFDGATGLYYGILDNIVRCNAHDFWGHPWSKHVEAVDRNKGRLHPNVEAFVGPEFTVLPHYIGFLLGRRSEPHGDRIRILEAQVSAWAVGVISTKAACFRLHLGWLYLDSLQTMDALGGAGKASYCGGTTDAQIPLLDHWCGRRDMSDWFEDFKYDEWEMRWQRCGGWETPDGNGYRTPAIDWLMGYKVYSR